MTESLVQTELDETVHTLRGSLTDLIVSAGGNPSKPQEVSRRFGIDKSLCWKVSRVIKATDPSAALPHVPGDAAIEIFLAAMEKAGAAHQQLQRVRNAFQSLNTTVEKHFGDRPTLDIILDSMPGQRESRLATSRKLAYRGNSGIWGVQARVRVNTIFLAPNREEPDLVDSILVGGWVDFRRLRSDSEWTIFKRNAFRDGKIVNSDEVPIDPTEAPHGPMLLREFCTPSLPPLATTEEDGVVSYDLGPSSVGNSGTFSCFFGSMHHKLGSRYAANSDDSADFFATISAPTEILLFDLIVHHSLSFALKPSVYVYGSMSTEPNQRKKRDLLPIEPVMQEIGSRPPVVATPLVSNYSQIVDRVFSSANWDARDFVGIRYTLDYPPFQSTIGVKLPLERR